MWLTVQRQKVVPPQSLSGVRGKTKGHQTHPADRADHQPLPPVPGITCSADYSRRFTPTLAAVCSRQYRGDGQQPDNRNQRSDQALRVQASQEEHHAHESANPQHYHSVHRRRALSSTFCARAFSHCAPCSHGLPRAHREQPCACPHLLFLPSLRMVPWDREKGDMSCRRGLFRRYICTNRW